MDLAAYMQIGELEEIAKRNGIEVPRLRGYRLMKEEKPISQAEIDRMKKDAEIDVVKQLCSARPFWSGDPEYWIGDAKNRYATRLLSD